MGPDYKYVATAVILESVFGINLRSPTIVFSSVLVLLDGVITSDVRMFKMLNTFVAIILCIIAGTKLLFVFRDVVNGVLKKLGFDHKKTGTTV